MKKHLKNIINIILKKQTDKYLIFFASNVFFVLLFSPVSIANPLKELKIVGEAKLKILFWDIYNSSFYSKTGYYQENQYPQALKINYLRDIKAEDLLEKTQREWEKLRIKKKINRWIKLLKNIYPNIKKGDTLLFIVYENQKSEFYFNNKKIIKISDKNFGKSFLRIWLDENCSYPNLRKKLIGYNK